MDKRALAPLQKGFTLLEVTMLVLIISILAAISIPVYNNYTAKSSFSAVISGAMPTLAAIGTCASTGDCVSGGQLTLQGVLPTNGGSSYAAIAAIESGYYSTTIDPSSGLTLAALYGDTPQALNSDAQSWYSSGWSAMQDPSNPSVYCMSLGGVCGIMRVPASVFNSYYAAWALNIPCIGTSVLCTAPTKYVATAAANGDGSVTATAVNNYGLKGETVVFVPSFFNGRIDWSTSGTCKTRAGGPIC